MSATAWSIVGDGVGTTYALWLYITFAASMVGHLFGELKGAADLIAMTIVFYIGVTVAHIVLRLFHHFHIPHYRMAVATVGGVATTMLFVALAYVYDSPRFEFSFIVAFSMFMSLALYAVIRGTGLLEPRYEERYKRHFLDRMTDHHINNQISPLINALANNDIVHARKLTLALANEFRFAGRRFTNPTQPLSEEFASAKNRMTITCCHYRTAIGIFIQDPKADSLTVPTEILQPLVENALHQSYRDQLNYLGIFVQSQLIEEKGDPVLLVDVLSAFVPTEWVDATSDYQQMKDSFAALLAEVRTDCLSHIVVTVEEPEDGLPLTAEAANNHWGRRALLYAGEIAIAPFVGAVPPYITRLKVLKPT